MGFSRVTRQMVAWNGRGETIAWTLRSPDLTPLDFYVLGYVKDQVFVAPLLERVQELWARITKAVATIDEDKIHRIWGEIFNRWNIWRVTRENYIGQL
jgi:hypothetical protein